MAKTNKELVILEDGKEIARVNIKDALYMVLKRKYIRKHSPSIKSAGVLK